MKQAADNTATKHDIAMLKAQEAKGLEGVSSDINNLKQKVELDTASKEDITRLEKKIDKLKVGQDECDNQPNNSGKILNNRLLETWNAENLGLQEIGQISVWANAKQISRRVNSDLTGS